MTPEQRAEWERAMAPLLEEVYPDAPAGPASPQSNGGGRANGHGRQSGPRAGHPGFGETTEREHHDAPPGGFTYVSLAELLERPEPAYRFVVDDLLPAAGSSLLVAKPKVGKTVLALQAARDVAAGLPYLGRAVRQGTVLYHAFEEKDDEVARIMRRARVTPTWPIQFHFAEIPRDRIAALRAAIMAQRPTLVVIDTLAYWMQVEDFDDYGQVSRAMRPLHRLARDTDTHIMAVHHAGKTREGIDAALGSTALTGNVDTIMVETDLEGGRMLETKQRYGPNLPRTLLCYDAETGCLSMGDGVAASKARSLQDEALTAVADGKHLETDIRAALRCGRNPLLEALNALVARSLLRRTGSGHRNSPYMYELAEGSEQDEARLI